MEDDALDLSEYVAILWRRKIILVVVAAVVAVAATQLLRSTLSGETFYTSSVEVLPGSTVLADSRSNIDALIATETALVLSTRTELAAIELVGAAGTAEGDDFFDDVTVRRVDDALVLEIVVRADDPFEAQTKADAIASAYLSTRQERLEAVSTARLVDLEAEITTIEASLELASLAVAVAEEGSSEALEAQARQDVLVAQLTELNTSLSSLRTTAIDVGTVLRAAEQGDPEDSVGGARSLAPLAGIFVGLLAGIVAAFVVDRLDPRLKSSSEIERLTGGILGEVSSAAAKAEIVPAEVGRLASVLSIRMERAGVDRIVVASATRKPSPLPAQIAAGLATAGHQVGFVARPGGVSVAQIERGLENAGHLMRGSLFPLDASMAGHDIAPGALVVIDGGTEVVDPSFSGLARDSVAAVIILRPGSTRRSQLRRLVGIADQVGFPVLGAVTQRSSTIPTPRSVRADRSAMTGASTDGPELERAS